jgi:hypothetical protein
VDVFALTESVQLEDEWRFALLLKTREKSLLDEDLRRLDPSAQLERI